ncbi:hypothetical protein ACHAQJ_002329 [Trichoderma viride]
MLRPASSYQLKVQVSRVGTATRPVTGPSLGEAPEDARSAFTMDVLSLFFWDHTLPRRFDTNSRWTADGFLREVEAKWSPALPTVYSLELM